MAEFDWSPKEKGVILSAFSWGLMTAPLGAFISRKYGGVTAFGMGIAVTGVLTVSTPYFMQCNLLIYLAVRILEGIAEV